MVGVIKECIGISEDRMHHILGVARRCYQIAKSEGLDELTARKCFMLGYLHDVGYEFSRVQEEHPDVSVSMLESIGLDTNTDFCKAIELHGRYPKLESDDDESVLWRILNMADLTVNSKGEFVNVTARLDDIKDRYGEYSNQFLTACDVAYLVGLTATNLGARY